MSFRVVDLSLPYRRGMSYVKIEPEALVEETGVNLTLLSLSVHAGTHLDAPIHWLRGGRTVDHLDLEKCVGPALVVDLTHKPPDSLISVEDMGAYAGRIGPGSRLILRTDWDAHAWQPDYRTAFPRLSLEMARWLADRNIWLLGIDMPSVASLKEGDRQELADVHRALLAAEIVIVESMANLRDLRGDAVFIVASPLSIEGSDGSPVRALGIEGLASS